MKKLFALLCLAMAAHFGFNLGNCKNENTPLSASLEKEFPLKERKTFVFIIYADNQEDWIAKSLQSIFEQEYDYYRIVFIDDGSTDNTFALAKSFILENNQEARSLFIRNEQKQGMNVCLYQAVLGLLDQEIAIPILGKNWLSHSGVLTKMNALFQNPDIWVAEGAAISYPSYEEQNLGFAAFYAALFKQISMDKFQNGDENAFLGPLKELAGKRAKAFADILLFDNQTF